MPTTTPETMMPVNIDESIVQVWTDDVLEATGVVIGDGSKALTAIDYEVSYPERVNVITPNGDNFTAAIQALDPRTGATLLDVTGMKLPPAETGKTPASTQPQNTFAVWYGQTYSQSGPAKTELETSRVTVIPDPDNVKLIVGISRTSPGGGMDNPPYIRQGAVITDDKGTVLGMVGVDYMSLFPHPHPFPFIPPGFTISSALELLSPDFATKPYADGPLMIVITANGASAMHLSYFANYDAVTQVMQKTFRRLGEPLKPEELPENIYDVTSNGQNGNAVTVDYARPVELSNPAGTIHVQAKWVCIQWGRPDGKPNALYYGSGRMMLEGGFRMPDDLATMQAVIDPLAYHQP
jgi:hypothetical protein